MNESWFIAVGECHMSNGTFQLWCDAPCVIHIFLEGKRWARVRDAAVECV